MQVRYQLRQRPRRVHPTTACARSRRADEPIDPWHELKGIRVGRRVDQPWKRPSDRQPASDTANPGRRHSGVICREGPGRRLGRRRERHRPRPRRCDPEDLLRLEHELGIVPADNLFEGRRTTRIYNLLVHGPLYERIPVHPNVLPIVEQVLDPGLLISSLSSISIGSRRTGPAHPLRRPAHPAAETTPSAHLQHHVGHHRFHRGKRRHPSLPGHPSR